MPQSSDGYFGSLFCSIIDLYLLDLDFRPLRRVIAYNSSVDEAVNNPLVPQVPLIEQAKAVARNADANAAWVQTRSLCLSQGFMLNTSLDDGRVRHTISFSEGGMAVVPWLNFDPSFGDCGFICHTRKTTKLG